MFPRMLTLSASVALVSTLLFGGAQSDAGEAATSANNHWCC